MICIYISNIIFTKNLFERHPFKGFFFIQEAGGCHVGTVSEFGGLEIVCNRCGSHLGPATREFPRMKILPSQKFFTLSLSTKIWNYWGLHVWIGKLDKIVNFYFMVRNGWVRTYPQQMGSSESHHHWKVPWTCRGLYLLDSKVSNRKKSNLFSGGGLGVSMDVLESAWNSDYVKVERLKGFSEHL